MWKSWLQNAWISLYFLLVRPMWKWIARKYTGQCELLRITCKQDEGAARTKQIEKSLKHSRMSVAKIVLNDDNVDVEQVVKEIASIKIVYPEVYPSFEPCLKVCLQYIVGYRDLMSMVDGLKKTKYDKTIDSHEKLLFQLWDLLCPDQTLQNRVSDQWKELGFQGDDPATDFRGMGILGLTQLVYFAQKYAKEAKQLLSHSHHPKQGYPFAIVGINLTSVGYDLLMSRVLRTHFYNLPLPQPPLDQFHDVYCHLFYEFDKFWIESNPKDIMEFGPIQKKFRRQIKHKLKTNVNTVLKTEFSSPTE